MIPLFLLVLLFPLLSATSSPVCNETSACLFFTTCFGGSYIPVADSAILKAENITTFISFDDAMQTKKSCEGIGLISKLSIESTSLSTLKISFESDIKPFALGLGKRPNFILLNLSDTDHPIKYKVNGQEVKEDNTTKFDVNEVNELGRNVYEFNVTHPNGLPVGVFFSPHVNFTTGGFTNETTVDAFKKDLQAKLACDINLIHDACHSREDCLKPSVYPRKVTCDAGQLEYSRLESKAASSYFRVDSVDCIDQKWKFTIEGAKALENEREFNVLCRKIAPSSTTTVPLVETTQVVDHEETTEKEKEEKEEMEEKGEKGEKGNKEEKEEKGEKKEKGEKGENGKKPAPVVHASQQLDKEPKNEKRKEENRLPGNKWLWIGGGGGILLLIITVNVAVCFIIRNRSRNSTTERKQSKASKMSKKKKGGKGPEYSDVSLISSEKSNKAKPSKSNASNSSDAQSTAFNTVMHLDRLKTEVVV